MKNCVFYLIVWSFWKTGRALAPTLKVDTKSTLLSESETSSKQLVTASCVSDPPGKSCDVDIRNIYPTNPCGTCFAVLPCGLKFCLRYQAGLGTLNPTVAPRYTITLIGTDADGNQALTAVDVNIKPITPPYFNPGTYVGMHKYFSGFSNSGTYTVSATDEDLDIVTYSMTTVPSTSGVKIDGLSGAITATRDLRYECRSSIAALVYAKDNYHTELSSPLSVTLDISNPNTRPIINNLDTDLYIREDEAVGATAFSLAVFDGGTDYPVNLAYTVSTAPPSAASLLTLSPTTNSILVSKALDYESQPQTFTMTIQASDGFCSSESHTLTVHIVDINEPPTLFPVDQTILSCEGLVDIIPFWNASDPDLNDQIKFTSISPNDQGRFKVNENTGVISTTIDYDLDVDKLAAIVIEVVTLSDRQGRSVSATVTILFQDCNDNAPFFKTPCGTFLVRDCWAAGTAIDQVPSASDDDSSFNQNDVISYSGSGTGVIVDPSGSLVTTKVFTAGETSTFAVHATDHGKVPGPLISKDFLVSVYCLPCIDNPPAVKTTESTVNTTAVPVLLNVASQTGNFVFLALAALLAAILLSLLLYFLWRYCWGRLRQCCAKRRTWCKKQPRKENRKENREPSHRPTPPPEPAHPGFIFGWWKETYTNADYQKTPERNAIPETSKGPELVDTNTYDVEPVVPPTPVPPAPSSSCTVM